MTERDTAWLQRRAQAWRDIETSLPALEDNKPISYDTVQQVVRVYPELARDVAVARREAPDSRTTAYLELVYRRLHRVVFTRPRGLFADVVAALRVDVPAIVWHLRWQIFSIALGFVLTGLAGWWLVSTHPELGGLFASRSMIDGLESGELWTDGLLNIMPSSVLSVEIFANNIIVALTAMSLGVLYGLGTIYIIALNGLMLGSMFALTAQYEMAGRLFDFVVAHGFVELSVIVVAGAVGFSLGEALARPGNNTRSQAFRDAAESGMKLMAVCVVFLVGAGVIEGFVSPHPAYDRGARIAIGVAYWLVFVWAIIGWDPQRKVTPAAET